ncbi:MAG: hypothetical protein AOA65_0788 [Candidatus Bathyarchaeota archaeon BA1]|nr:MAG: hypothetical protein AOA65_0788 [Candidatus Bathyarchaeota archaeon BA1]
MSVRISPAKSPFSVSGLILNTKPYGVSILYGKIPRKMMIVRRVDEHKGLSSTTHKIELDEELSSVKGGASGPL